VAGPALIELDGWAPARIEAARLDELRLDAQELLVDDGAVSSVAFSPDGLRLASVDTKGVVRVWALDLDELVRIAEHELTRDLTDAECRQYLHQPNCG
jgi:WD40 repeat protein